jgi:hypothetical protein
MPAKISFLRPVASMARDTRVSSNALTEERSMISIPGSASTSSGNIGPHMLSRAVVVTTIGSFNAFAALARATTLCFSSPVDLLDGLPGSAPLKCIKACQQSGKLQGKPLRQSRTVGGKR